MMPSAISVLKGTRDIHQAISEKSGIIEHRKLSCFCNGHKSSGKSCECYYPRTFGYTELLRPTHSFTDIGTEVQPDASLQKLAEPHSEVDPDSEVDSESLRQNSTKFHTDEKNRGNANNRSTKKKTRQKCTNSKKKVRKTTCRHDNRRSQVLTVPAQPKKLKHRGHT